IEPLNIEGSSECVPEHALERDEVALRRIGQGSRKPAGKADNAREQLRVIDAELHGSRAAHRETADEASLPTGESWKAPVDLCDEIGGEGGFDVAGTVWIGIVHVPARICRRGDGNYRRDRTLGDGVVEQLGQTAAVEPLSLIAAGAVQ